MVADPRTPLHADQLRTLNVPRPLTVRATPESTPLAVRRGHAWVPVEAILERWRIDDEWWRPQPISRLYFHLALADGAHLVVFCDLLNGQWYRQYDAADAHS